nr:MAG TPA: type I neck protein [Caudoviricetes sp.]
MARMGKFDAKDMKKFQKKLLELQDDPDKLLCDCAKKIAAMLLKVAISRTPAITGTLKRGWDIQIRQEGNNYIVELSNSVWYALYVNYGHRQEPGRYVPAIGKTLKKGFVPGNHMLEKSVTDVKNVLPEVLEKEIYDYLKDTFK